MQIRRKYVEGKCEKEKKNDNKSKKRVRDIYVSLQQQKKNVLTIEIVLQGTKNQKK